LQFEEFWQQAIFHHGSANEVEARLPMHLPDSALVQRTDSEYLSLLTRRVFRAGMKHSVVDSRWPAFEEAFWQFNRKLVS
jgi:3-methyladenine DNA glycosylase Tag